MSIESVMLLQTEVNPDTLLTLFDLLSIAFVIIIHKGLPQRILPLCLLKYLFFRTLSTCRGQREEINTSSCPRLAILGDTCKITRPLYFLSLPPLPVSDP